MYPFLNDDSTDFQIVPDRFLKLKSEIFLQHVVQTIYQASFIFGNLVFTHFQLRFASLGKIIHKHLMFNVGTGAITAKPYIQNTS